MIHVYPEAEEDQHELEGTSCPCGVDVEWDLPEAVVLHHRIGVGLNHESESDHHHR